jgi:predicted adenine nucleotide alpha hydrolase (AANH) superfamily ATPase
MNVLLHTCCAPCASHCVLTLQALGHDVTLFYSNANIAPPEEFLRRLDAVRLLADRVSVPLLIDEPDHDAWLREAASGFETEPERGARCARCFRFSLCRTREAMAAHGLDAFTTTLTVSPHKHAPTLFQVGHDLDAARFLAIDFKKRDGFKHSIQLAEAFGLYRQSYCGCEFSYRSENSVPKL